MPHPPPHTHTPRQHLQHIVLPESLDKRVLAAAADVAQRGLARITLLGEPGTIQAEAAKLGLDLSSCAIVDPLVSKHRALITE